MTNRKHHITRKRSLHHPRTTSTITPISPMRRINGPNPNRHAHQATHKHNLIISRRKRQPKLKRTQGRLNIIQRQQSRTQRNHSLRITGLILLHRNRHLTPRSLPILTPTIVRPRTSRARMITSNPMRPIPTRIGFKLIQRLRIRKHRTTIHITNIRPYGTNTRPIIRFRHRINSTRQLRSTQLRRLTRTLTNSTLSSLTRPISITTMLPTLTQIRLRQHRSKHTKHNSSTKLTLTLHRPIMNFTRRVMTRTPNVNRRIPNHSLTPKQTRSQLTLLIRTFSSLRHTSIKHVNFHKHIRIRPTLLSRLRHHHHHSHLNNQRRHGRTINHRKLITIRPTRAHHTLVRVNITIHHRHRRTQRPQLATSSTIRRTVNHNPRVLTRPILSPYKPYDSNYETTPTPPHNKHHPPLRTVIGLK